MAKSKSTIIRIEKYDLQHLRSILSCLESFMLLSEIPSIVSNNRDWLDTWLTKYDSKHTQGKESKE